MPPALLALLLPSVATAALRLTPVQGTVETMAGDGGRWAPTLIEDRLLGPGDRMRTASDATAWLATSGNSVLGVGPGSVVAIVRPGDGGAGDEATILDLAEGSLSGSMGDSEGLGIIAGAVRFAVRWGAFEVSHQKKGGVRASVGTGRTTVFLPGRRVVELGEGESLQAEAAGRNSRVTKTPARKPAAAKRATGVPVPVPAGPAGDVAELLAALEKDPFDARARKGLDEAVALLAKREDAAAPLGAPLADVERQSILYAAHRALAAQLDDEALEAVFNEGLDALASGRPLEALDYFELCRLLGSGQGWFQAALDSYIGVDVPRDTARVAGDLGEGAGARYAAVYRAMSARSWPEAAEILKSLVSSLEGSIEWRPEEVKGVLGEISRLAARLDLRVGTNDTAETREGRLANLLRSRDSDPRTKVRAIEGFLMRWHAEAREPWWQRGAEGLRRAHSELEVDVLLADARSSAERGDVKKSAQFLVRVLQRAPENTRALDMLEALERRVAARPAARPSTPSPVPSPAPAPAATPEKTTLRDRVQAEAYYHRGLRAYLQGDLARAADEWTQAVEFDAEHAKAGKALARVRKEMGGVPRAGGR